MTRPRWSSRRRRARSSPTSADDPATPLDHVRIASDTKTFTTGVILELAAAGKLVLEEMRAGDIRFDVQNLRFP